MRRSIPALLVILLAACTPAAPATPVATATLSPTPTTTPFTFPATETPVPSASPISAAAATGTATPTPFSILAGPTPTFDARSAVTRTQMPPGLCPARNLNVLADDEAWDQLIADRETEALLEAILYHLNIGGGLNPVTAALTRLRGAGEVRFFQEQDVTNDGLADVVFATDRAYVLFCAAGFYEMQAVPAEPPGELTRVVAVLDLNRTGVPEIVLAWDGVPCGTGTCSALAVLEWDGREFAGLVETDPGNEGLEYARMDTEFDARVRDTDANGTAEILLDGEIPEGEAFRDGLPWRERSDTYMWNGVHFVLHRTRFTTPVYRFQAVQDGDLFTLQGAYDLALLSYQSAVFGDAPEWWSPERAEELRARWDAEQDGEAPTPAPSQEDPAEYPHLAAYARFRILVLYVVQGWLSDAETVYTTLLGVYPEAEPGSVFSTMATEFWEAYQETGSVREACGAAIDVAEAHPEVLFYLGAAHHGGQSRIYAPGDVCPFGS